MATVIRVQNSAGEGPYRYLPIIHEVENMAAEHVNADTHPKPQREGMSKWHGNFRCGFRDMNQLCRWFSPQELAMLKRNGFDVIMLHDVKIVAELKHQTVFEYADEKFEDKVMVVDDIDF